MNEICPEITEKMEGENCQKVQHSLTGANRTEAWTVVANLFDIYHGHLYLCVERQLSDCQSTVNQQWSAGISMEGLSMVS